METKTAVVALAALAQESRLSVFRLLVEAGSAGMAAGKIAVSPIRGHVAAISVGMQGGRALLDLEYVEDVACDTDMNVVMTGAGHFVEVQGTAEGEAFSRDDMNAMLALAEKGIGELVQLQRQALGL